MLDDDNEEEYENLNGSILSSFPGRCEMRLAFTENLCNCRVESDKGFLVICLILVAENGAWSRRNG